jgi:DNA-binding transcriptional ArsR family regulator
LILSPEEISPDIIEEEVPQGLDMGKIQIETLGWFDDALEQTLQQTLRTIELLVNETRMRMLAPLLQKSALKRDFRARINPKLVYHNLTALSEAGIVDEPVEGTFELSQLGKTVLPEFIAFLEKTRKTLHDYRSKEVNSIGRR